MPGPPPLPAEQHRRRGNPSHKKLPDVSGVVALAPADGVPPVPPSLRESGARAWSRLWAAGAAWLAPQTDVAIMTRLCEAYDTRAAMLAVIERDGLMIAGSM